MSIIDNIVLVKYHMLRKMDNILLLFNILKVCRFFVIKHSGFTGDFVYTCSILLLLLFF